MNNPFRYGMRVGGSEFFDRSTIMRAIRNTLDGGNNVLVYGPHRYGKSSMVGEILSSLRASGAVCVELNLMDVASLDDFIARYAAAVYREFAPATGALKHVAGLDALRDVLELPEKLCPQKRHAYIALDEFQAVAELVSISFSAPQTLAKSMTCRVPSTITEVISSSESVVTASVAAWMTASYFASSKANVLTSPCRNRTPGYLPSRGYRFMNFPGSRERIVHSSSATSGCRSR